MNGLCNSCKKPGEFYPSNPRQCKECYKVSKAKYRSTAKYLKTSNEYSKKWRTENPELQSAQGKRTYRNTKANPDRAAVLMVTRRRNSCKERNIPFEITAKDITPLPDSCPILGIPLFFGDGVFGPNSPTIDRIDSNRGYEKGNVMVISHRANTLKSNATVEELEKVLNFVRSLRVKLVGVKSYV